MSYNIQGHAVLRRPLHIGEVASVLRQIRPDVVGLQEVHRKTTRGGGRDQLEEIGRLSGMNFHFGRSVSAWGGEYGNAVLTRGEIREGIVHTLPGAGEPRTMLECRIDLRGCVFTIFVTHLAAWFRLHRKARAQQLARIGEILHSAERPFLLVGDFNTPPRAPEMRDILSNERLRVCGEHVERSHQLSRQRLDYVFADPSWTTRDSWVMRLGPSDHWPLVADLEQPGDTA